VSPKGSKLMEEEVSGIKKASQELMKKLLQAVESIADREGLDHHAKRVLLDELMMLTVSNLLETHVMLVNKVEKEIIEGLEA